jgi:hypothetical protein
MEYKSRHSQKHKKLDKSRTISNPTLDRRLLESHTIQLTQETNRIVASKGTQQLTREKTTN